LKRPQEDYDVVFATVKRWLGLDEPDEYERETLEREYRRLEEKIQRIEGELGTVNCQSCPTSLNPKAERLLKKKRSHEDRQAEIEARLGEAPTISDRTRRTSKRNGGS
jgi:PAS domain-containing protein